MKITQSKTHHSLPTHDYYRTSGDCPFCLSVTHFHLFQPGNVRKPTVGLHHKQIMSNCKCVCFLKGGGGARVNGVSLPPSSGFALPACRPTELGFDSGSGGSVRDQNRHSPYCILSLSGAPMWVSGQVLCLHTCW